MKMRMREVVLPTDRWQARAISPFDVSKGIDTDKYGEVVVVHPGWAKAPERHGRLLVRLADEGFLPIGVDTRYAYSDRRTPRKSLTSQRFRVGNTNPFFEATPQDNRWRYRRPTVLLDVCERLGVTRRSYIGHSDGGRIAVIAAVADPSNVNKLIVVNGAGTGDSSGGAKRLTISNANRIGEFVSDVREIPAATASAIGSTVYALTHLRRTLAEKRAIQQADTWGEIDRLEDTETDVTVLHARNDKLISFNDSARAAEQRQWVDFVPTIGGHSNVYEPAVQVQIIQSLQQW
jgi:pimeloyl-ACP methyl ester carboxylesterase